jgi:hypothetical protein
MVVSPGTRRGATSFLRVRQQQDGERGRRVAHQSRGLIGSISVFGQPLPFLQVLDNVNRVKW